MDMRRVNVELHIRELLIDDRGSVDADEISNGLQQELTRLLDRDQSGVDLSNSAMLDSIEVKSQDRGGSIGAELARAIFRELQK